MVRGTARSLAAALTLRSTVVRSLAYEAQLRRIAVRVGVTNAHHGQNALHY